MYNLTCRIDVSTDLANCSVLTNVATPTGTVSFKDLDATNFGKRFYRANWVP